MSALVAIIASAAAKVGAELVGQAVGGIFGPAGGQLAETVVTSVAEKLGVEPGAIATVPATELEAAVQSVEADMPEKIALWAKALDGQLQLQLAEMGKEQTWTWAWRPAWMWLLAFVWAWRLILVPLLDARLGWWLAESINVDTLWWLTTLFAGFYMGGHTAKDLMSKWISKSS